MGERKIGRRGAEKGVRMRGRATGEMGEKRMDVGNINFRHLHGTAGIIFYKFILIFLLSGQRLA